MLRIVPMAALFVIAALLTSVAKASDEQDQKKPAPDWVPPPKMVPPTITIMPYNPRSDTREVWQHYGVNSFGRFVPRVIRTPYGDYYSRNLEPYPWAANYPRAWLP